MNALAAGYAGAVRPPAETDIVDWAQKHVRLVDGKTPFWDVATTPWLADPLRAMVDAETREVLLLLPTGSGKSAVFETFLAHAVAEAPKTIQCSHQTDRPAALWVESRVLPTLRLCAASRVHVEAAHRHKTRKLELVLPHMTIFFGGANDRNLQDRSVQVVAGQEVWDWPRGAIAQAKARDHDRLSAKTILCGQGGAEGGEWEAEIEVAELREFQFSCPHCGARAAWIGRNGDPRDCFRAVMTWDEAEAARSNSDWGKIYRSVRFVAPCCGHRFRDLVSTRRKLATSGRYVTTGGGGIPGWVAYTAPALALWWVPWAKLVREFVVAGRNELAGDDSAMEAFVTKRLCRFWAPRGLTPQIDTERDRYSRHDIWPETGKRAPRWPDEAFRFLTVDVQADHYWCVIRAWRLNADSRLLWEGRVESIESVRELQGRFEIPNLSVGVDCGFELERVARYRLRYGEAGEGDAMHYWYLLRGDRTGEGYPDRPGSAGRRRMLPYSRVRSGKTPAGVVYRYVKFSNLLAKNTLAGLMGNDSRYFGVFHDHSSDYGVQMRSETKREVTPTVWRWEKLKEKTPNHLWDCEVMGVVLACIKGVVRWRPGEEIEEKD